VLTSEDVEISSIFFGRFSSAIRSRILSKFGKAKTHHSVGTICSVNRWSDFLKFLFVWIYLPPTIQVSLTTRTITYRQFFKFLRCSASIIRFCILSKLGKTKKHITLSLLYAALIVRVISKIFVCLVFFYPQQIRSADNTNNYLPSIL
jgi:hypothetical protein